ncbi:MAG: DUF3047 domain-containing protein [Deltaproteobacteria bacterium]|nr:DUF3047 domain-containing protein [Deltaproteobacteria bacterium]
MAQPILPTLTGRRIAASLFFFVLLILSPAPGASAAEDGTVPAAHFASTELVQGIPPGWVLDRKAGKVNLRLEKAGKNFVVRLASDRNSSFGIKRELHVDLKEYPFLNWRWRAVRLPRGGDVRNAATDDQAVQLYVAFPATGFPEALNTPIIGYIWDNEAPRGWTGRSEQIGGGKLRYLVVRNRADRLGEWYAERRNVYEDFRNFFWDLKEVGTVTHGIQFHINSQYTKSDAEGCIGDVFFSRPDTRGPTASAPFPVVR